MNREHLKAVLWLRWRLTQNQWTRSRGIGAIISAMIAMAVAMIAVSSFLLAALLGYMLLEDASPATVMGTWLGVTALFLVVWVLELVQEIQRSETIDLQRMLHLPVALGPIFTINYLASHFALSVVLAVPVMLGLTLGLTLARGPMMLLLAPLALSLVFMITAWTYCLRGWLAGLMSNPRRRRRVVVLVTCLLMVIFQAPYFYLHFIQRRDMPRAGASPEEMQRYMSARRTPDQNMLSQYLVIQRYVPPLWLAAGAKGLAEGAAWPALLGTLGCAAIGTMGIRRAYRSTVRAYRGDSGAKPDAVVERRTDVTAAPSASGRESGEWLMRRLPGVPEQAAAVAVATFQSMLRAPEVKMAMGTSLLMTLIGAGTLVFRNTWQAPPWATPLLVTGSAALSTFMLMQLFNNQFGFDRDGFRAFILSPADRRLILLGKNLAGVPWAAGFGVVLLAITSVWIKPPAVAVLAGLFQLAMLLALAAMLGNLLSILAPYRMQAGTLKPSKAPGLVMLVMFVAIFFVPVVMSPSLAGPVAEYAWRESGRTGGEYINLLVSAVMTALIVALYWM